MEFLGNQAIWSRNWHVMSPSLSYYLRLFTYVACLILFIELFARIPQMTIAALKAIILFALFLCILSFLKVFYPAVFDIVKWFCSPGVVFLKSWTSLFFFVYLVQLPSQLSTIPPVQILSWVFQGCLGNLFALAISTISIGLFLKAFPWIDVHHKPDPTDDSVDKNHPSIKPSVSEMESIEDSLDICENEKNSKWIPVELAENVTHDIEMSCVENSSTSVANPTFELATLPSSRSQDSQSTPRDPFIPTPDMIFRFWFHFMLFIAFLCVLSPRKSTWIVILFQLSSAVCIYQISTTYRLRVISFLPKFLQEVLQAPILFMLLMIFCVILSSKEGWSHWSDGLKSFLVPSSTILDIKSYGAGNYLAIFLNPAIVSLAFTALDPLLVYGRVVFALMPVLFMVCLMIYLAAAGLSKALHSPESIALPLLVHSITTPVAIAISTLTHANLGLTAATAVLNGLLGLRVDIPLLSYFGVYHPVNRGVSIGTAGTLLGIIALDELEEEEAAGVGMAGYSMATIIFAILMAITPLQQFLVDLAT